MRSGPAVVPPSTSVPTEVSSNRRPRCRRGAWHTRPQVLRQANNPCPVAMTIAYITHPACRLHEMGAGHPESPSRLSAIEDRIIETGFDFALRRFDSPAATREQLVRVHDPSYVERIFELAPRRGHVWLDDDTAMNPHSLEAALHAAGAVILAVDLVVGGEARSAFCGVRPPGHHAARAATMGFCIFNNVAVGAAHALERYGLQRVAIVDFDVHHGNGTEDIFREEARVLFCSSFQHPFYPFTDVKASGQHIVKTPLAAGAGSHSFRLAVGDAWLTALETFRPELILISAGFDAHWQDEMAGLNLTEHDYAWITREISAIADASAHGRIVSVLEGGYALPALARSVLAHLSALLD
jgi:acetoin utilization deacetylase AcuC-like enzyme